MQIACSTRALRTLTIMKQPKNNPKKILILGGGFGGLTVAKSIRHPDADLLLLDKQNHHLFQPLLYQVATASLAAPNIAQPLRTIFRDRPEVTTLMAEVQDIDLDEQTVITKTRRIPYDYLVIALGGKTNYFGNDHWEPFAPGLKTLSDAHRIRNQVLEAYERAENCRGNEEEQQRLMTTVIVGAGPTGVEMAGTLAELSKRLFKKDFRNIHPEQSRVVLLDAANRPLVAYSESVSQKARQQLESLGVELVFEAPVMDIREGEVELPNRIIQAGTIVWSAGVEAHKITRKLAVPKGKGERLAVQPDCSLPGYPEVFAIGDIVSLTDVKGQDVPGVAPAAIQMANHVARIIKAELQGKPRTDERPAFKYKDQGSMATIGRSRAVVETGKLNMSGFPAWATWLVIHLVLLMGMRNRLLVLLQWFFAYVRNKPGARILWKPSPGPTVNISDSKDEKTSGDPTGL